MIRKDFCTFILTHGRPDKVRTYQALKKGNYTGPVYIVCDNEDKKLEEYKRKFDNVLVFDKKAISLTFDTADLSQERRTIVYARNACFNFAKQLGYDYFLELDDDYTVFEYRRVKNDTLAHINAKQLDKLFNLMIDFLEITKAPSVCLAQGGDYLGGENSTIFRKKVTHKAMNTFFCKTSRPFTFVGRINEDVNTYTSMARRGEVMFTVGDANIQQMQTQKNAGGMSDDYLDKGTYLKSFYTILYTPSAVKIGSMGEKHKRIHHKVLWNYCAPKIINQKYKKWS
jgi:hypothetical protein